MQHTNWFGLLSAGFMITAGTGLHAQSSPASGSGGAPEPLKWTAQQDHQDMMKQLGITKLRPGPSGRTGSTNSANYDTAKANPFPDLPDPLTLIVDRSPSFFVGQSVGGVYPPGPYAPDAKTILFLPTPSPDATAEQRESFFRDFNEHFNKMIVPHELIPGHYVQFKIAAHQPHKIRTIFPDPLYVEGWGTFCERLLLDQGWGGPLERLAHLKKQLENTARTIVDIRVHTENMSRDDVVRLVKDEALQNDQFASNMWTRAITSSPQITSYYLGYRKVREAYDAARARAGDKFELQKFMDGMMELGPVRLGHYIERFSAKNGDRSTQTQSRAK